MGCSNHSTSPVLIGCMGRVLYDNMRKHQPYFFLFQELITSTSTAAPPESEVAANSSSLHDINWTLCWKAWLNIGNQKANYITNTSEVVSQSQVLLTGFVQIFHALFPHVKATFRREDVESLGKVLLACAQVKT